MIEFRDITPEDYVWILSLNERCMPEVSAIDKLSLAHLMSIAEAGYLATKDDKPVGMIIVLQAGTGYDSENYRWFETHSEKFLYIDRIMISDEVRGQGVGDALYQNVTHLAVKLGMVRLVCEVNEDPPNPRSMNFHTRIGFQKIASYYNKSHNKQVAMLELGLLAHKNF